MSVVDVIIPIYGNIGEVKSCLESVFASTSRIPHDVILIDDASPDPRIETYLEQLAEIHQNVTSLRNRKNQGFVISANIGMAVHPDRDVVLLNSDTRVANDWLDRLYRCAYQDDVIGTVTPFSNNATICSFPHICEFNPMIDGWSVKALDQVFARVNAGEQIEIPTAVGFCMFIKRTCLQEVGLFDARSFGRGYGEENDFCMRAIRHG